MQKKWALFPFISLIFCCLLMGCSKTDTRELSSVTQSEQTTSNTASKNTSQTATSTQSNETTITTTTLLTTTEAIAATTQTETEANTNTTMQTYYAPAYACQIEIPTDWSATQGVSDNTITETIAVFQPNTANGDHIALLVQEQAEDPEVFASMTQTDFIEAYEQTFSSVSITELEKITIDGYAAYRVKIIGECDGLTVEVTQLLLNCTDSAYGQFLYSLTYTNYSGESPVYTQEIESYFHFIT